MTKKNLKKFEKITNNGLVGYLNENEIETLCKSVSDDAEVVSELKEHAVNRAKNINDVIVSKISQ